MLIAILLPIGVAALGLLWMGTPRPNKGAPPNPVPPTGWRLVLPREARFGVTEATAWFSSLLPLLPAGGTAAVELRGQAGELQLHVSAPAAAEPVLRSQLAAWFPGARLERRPPSERSVPVVALPLRLQQADLYPILIPTPTMPDPLLGLAGLLTQTELPGGLQIAWGPAPADWPRWAPAAWSAVKQGHRLPPRGGWFWLHQVAQWVQETHSPARGRSSRTVAPGLAGLERKVQGPVVQASLTVWAAGPSEAEASPRVRALADYLQAAYHAPSGNRLVPAGPPQRRVTELAASPLPGPWSVLSAGEMAGLFHIPAPGHPFRAGPTGRQVAPVPRLRLLRPGDASATRLGEALTPSGPRPFGLGPVERRLHLYVTGKTGTGKSTLLAGMIQQDMEAGRGLAVLDPHGDLAQRLLTLVPPTRDRDVIFFNPADTDFPMSLNLLAATSPAERPLRASGVISVFKKLFADSWGHRLEHLFRQGLLALLETPTPTLLLLPRLLTDQSFREDVLTHVRDPLLVHFFREEYERYEGRFRMEAVSPILNKVGQFLAMPALRHVVGPSRPGLDLRAVMDEGRIFIANLSTGMLGEDAAALLGGLLVAGFQLAAMGRADQPEEERRDFFLYVDEFQHYATDSFATLLSEARKFRVSLTLSHQYLSQLPEATREAVLGNVGMLTVFRVGAPDAARLAKELAPSFDVQDLVHLPNYQSCVRLTQAGETLPAFSARTLPLPPPLRDPTPLIEQSRRRWARPRPAVELEIADLWEGRVQ